MFPQLLAEQQQEVAAAVASFMMAPQSL